MLRPPSARAFLGLLVLGLPVPDPDHPDVRLAHALAALATPTRIALMRALRTPRILAEIEVKSHEPGSQRNLARQTVRQHLDVLLDAHMVSAHETERSRGETHEFVLNHQAVYALSEDLRALARLRPLVEPSMETAAANVGGAPAMRRPCLVLVKGLDEGTSFDLRPENGRHEWTIGRRRGAEVSLDFDPFVSSENSRIAWIDGAHYLENVPGSRNGTMHNFRPVEDGRRQRLQQGDVVGVGRSLLVYWA